MTTIEQAIKDALDAGWDDTNCAFASKDRDELQVGEWQYDSKVFLDPAFWQALGKARGWGKPKVMWSHFEQDTPYTLTQRWRNEMHCFIDHLAEGKDAESFFKDL